MMTHLLDGYCNGIVFARRIAKACRERIDVMSLVGLANPPDFRAISEFRRRHLQRRAATVTQCCGCASGPGWIKLAPRGARRDEDESQRLQAQSDERRADGQGRGGTGAPSVASCDGRRGDGWTRGEDADFGRGKSGEEMRIGSPTRCGAPTKIRAAKAEAGGRGESRRRSRAASAGRGGEETRGRGPQETRKTRRRASEDPDPKAQKNFTDPESRIMKTKDGFIQGYNAQAAVDAEAQVIVAAWRSTPIRATSIN